MHIPIITLNLILFCGRMVVGMAQPDWLSCNNRPVHAQQISTEEGGLFTVEVCQKLFDLCGHAF